MHKPLCNRYGRICRATFFIASTLNAVILAKPASAEGALQLEVLLNGQPIGLIGAFWQDANGELSAKRRELEELHLKVPDRFAADDEVALTKLPGVSYRYDAARQTVDITVSDASRAPQVYDHRQTLAALPVTPPSTGAVLNYLLFGGGDTHNNVISNWEFQGVSATLDGRLFSPYGIVSQTGILATNTDGNSVSPHLRLDSTWTYKDPDNAVTYRAGDTISGGLAWTRPIRLGGLQIQRDFAIRPDLVTLPLPSFSGSAAVPSTVDVYVNNVRTISQDVDSGPFRMTNLPILSGQGEANIVVRDSSGRDVETSLPFLVSNKLLAGGLFDYSVEAGYPRLFYGSRSNDYVATPAGSGSTRYGVSDHLTLEAHGEGTAGLANAGLGADFSIDRLGLISAAYAGSLHDKTPGGQLYVSFDTTIFGLAVSASTLRTQGGYDDLAAMTARPYGFIPVESLVPTSGLQNSLAQNPYWLLLPPKIQDQISIGFPVPLFKGSLNFGYVSQIYKYGSNAMLLNAGYTRQLFGGASFSVTAFTGFDTRRNTGIAFGISIPLGGDVTVSSGVSHDRSGYSIASDVDKPLRQEPGSFGWRLSDLEGDSTLRSASAAYRGENGKVEATAIQAPSGFSGTLDAEGAVVVAARDVFLTNRIDDAFAVVDAGAPDIDVYHENRPVTRTDSSGKAIVPSLNSYQPNKISIDPRDLPLDASIASTQELLVPADRSGVIADFGIKTNIRAAIIILNGSDGQPLTTGLRGKTAGGQSFVVGYEGRAYINGLEPNNVLTVQIPGGDCQAEFPYAPNGNPQEVIGPFVCK